MALTKLTETTERPFDDRGSLGSRWVGPDSTGCDGSMFDVHWEISIEHWVADDESRLNRLRWFVWNLLGVGNPPSRVERATAAEVTTVTTADSVLTLPKAPNRRLVKIVRRHPVGIGSPEDFASLGVVDH